MILVWSCRSLCTIHWTQELCREWRCSWSSTDRRCSNYIWVINDYFAYKGASYIRGLVVHFLECKWISLKISLKIVLIIVLINNIPALVQVWIGAEQATSHYLNQWWLVYCRIYASLGLNESISIVSCYNDCIKDKIKHKTDIYFYELCKIIYIYILDTLCCNIWQTPIVKIS